MTKTSVRFTARLHAPVITAAWGLFILLGAMAMDSFVRFMIAEVEWLAAFWPAAGSILRTVPSWGWTMLISMEIIVLGAVVIIFHESSHILAHRLLGTLASRIRFQMRGVNPNILVDGFESWPVKFLTTAAPLATTLLPALLILVVAQGSVLRGLFAFVAVMAWGVSVSEINVLLNYLRIPRNAKIRVSEGGELTEWIITNDLPA